METPYRNADQVDPPEPLPETRSRKRMVRYGIDYHIATVMLVNSEPRTLVEAMNTEQADDWWIAATAEDESLQAYDTWELTPLLEDRKPVGIKWVFKVK